ncbi:zinc finger protein 595-like [Ostrinia nubilalis]|uniref:zinc finger protein 595-like n=1 Tax=Ostrinia nubilalis TaxID=29057 RepID=UPI0030822DD5
MTSDESDDEPLSVLAAAKRLNPEKFETYETETTIEVIRPSKKKKKKYSRNDTVSITIKLHQPIKTTRPPKIVERPADVWMYIKDLNPTGPYSCLLCSEWFINRSKIILHYILNHKKDFCGICRYFVTERAVWQTHQKFHSPWPCSQCLDSFPTQVEWRKHFSEAHNLVHCRLCHFRTTDDDQYDVHLIEKHNVTNTESKNAEVIWEVEYLGCQNFLCLLCNKGDVFCNNFFNHYMGYHHFTLKCITNIISGNDPPFHVDGANVSTDFVTDQFNIKTGYLELEKKPDIADVQNEQDSGVKQEPLSDNENKEAKNSIVETYKGIEDFDVTLMELIVLNKCYFEYVNQTLSQINSNTVPEDSGIDYKTANDDVELDIECGVCKTCVTSIHTFSTHMLKMHSVRSVPIYSCRVCATTFDSQGELEAHVTEEMGEFDDLWLCQFCDKEFDNRENTRKHLNSHWDVMEFDNCFSPHLGFKCKYCPTLFWNEPDRETHQIRVHFVKYKEDFYKCENCSEIFSDKIWFIHHYVEKHQSEQEKVLFLVKCCVCCLVLNTVEDMRAHFEKQHSDARKIFCSLGACVFKPLSQRKSFKVHIKTVHATEEKKPPRPEVCTICTREFNSSRACATHMAQAHGARNYKCKLCRDVLHTVDERKLHYLIRHPGKHPYECSECGKSFQYKSSLYMHKQVHAPNKPTYTCSFCGKVFMYKSSLYMHKQVHAPNKPTYTCSFCGKVFMVSYLRLYLLVLRSSSEFGKSFQYKSSLYMHKQVHAPNKPTYTCSFCGKVFMVSYLRLYWLVLRPSSECGKSFQYKSSLYMHKQVHAPNKPTYTCSFCEKVFMVSYLRPYQLVLRPSLECGKSFQYKSSLYMHKQVHAPNKPTYTCSFCGKLFMVSYFRPY